MERSTKVSSRGRVSLLLLAFVAFLAMPLGISGLRSLEPVRFGAGPALIHHAVAGVSDSAARRVPVFHNQHGDPASPVPKVSSVLALAVVLFLVLGFVLLALAPVAALRRAAVGGIRSRAPPLVV